MLIPLGTDCALSRRPVITPALILVNLAVYLVGTAGRYFGWVEFDNLVRAGWFTIHDFKAWQLLTSQFLHDPSDVWHLAGNMIFLWIFGAAVEDRLGRVGFLGFYLIGGSVAAMAHAMGSPAPIIGASGSIAAVTGAFLAFFPRSRIRLLIVFFIIGVYALPSLWFVGFYFLLDVFSQTRELFGHGAGRVAHMAHIAGTLYGFTLAFTMLALRLVPRGEFDVFSLFRQSRRRAAFRGAVRTKDPWSTSVADRLTRGSRSDARGASEAVTEARRSILQQISAGNLPAAAEAYADLIETDDAVVLPEARQLDVANRLYKDDRHEPAAEAWERFLMRYPKSRQAPEVRLILGMLYARTLGRPDRARELITKAAKRLTNDGQRALAARLLEELAGDET